MGRRYRGSNARFGWDCGRSGRRLQTLSRLSVYFPAQWTSLGDGAMAAMLAAREARHSICVDFREGITGLAAGIGRVR